MSTHTYVEHRHTPAFGVGGEYCEVCGKPEADPGHAKPGNVFTRVIFRTYRKGGDVIALFPELEADDRGHCTCYQHVGQHGAASYARVMQDTRPASPEQYAPLLRELQGIGYRLFIRRRRR